jgi:hypothetical protein
VILNKIIGLIIIIIVAVAIIVVVVNIKHNIKTGVMPLTM